MNKPTEIILHCAATPDDGDKFGAKDIDVWHRSNGWSGIGYHWVIRRSGVLEKGRPEYKVPASIKGHNKNTIAICLMGTRYYEKAQYATLIGLLDEKMDQYQISVENVKGHYEFANKKCPGLDMTLVRRWIELELG
jgi:hypothetical protein